MILKGISIYPKPRTNKGYQGSRDPYYQSKEWKQLRAYKLQLNPLCEDCLELENRVTEGHTVDHIIPRKQGGKDSIENLRTRCKFHNSQKTALDNPNNSFDV
jgi:5-methylcytosine-specific restriction endonuclease McrA